jgi:cell division protein FtsB
VPRRLSPPSKRVRLVRWLGLAVVLAIAVAYIQPIRAYVDARDDVAERRAERNALLRERAELEHRLELSSTDEFLVREARRSLGLVRPGERLFVVNGLEEPGAADLP